jgi:phenylpyruvate tautomerase PptA (4-oxalocrotonate tautomerase family)
MPLVTLTVLGSTPAGERRALLDAVHDALVAVGVPPADRFQRVLALPADSLVYDPTYPEPPDRSASRRNDQFALVEVLWSAGRSVKVKKQLLEHLVDGLRRLGRDPEQLMLVFKETTWENWSFAGGRLLHA